MAPKHSKPMTQAEEQAEDKENNLKLRAAKRTKKMATKKTYIESDSSDDDCSKKQPFVPLSQAMKGSDLYHSDSSVEYVKTTTYSCEVKTTVKKEKDENSKPAARKRPSGGGTGWVFQDDVVNALAEGRKFDIKKYHDFLSIMKPVAVKEPELTESEKETLRLKKYKEELFSEEPDQPEVVTDSCRYCKCFPCIIDQEWKNAGEFVEMAREDGYDNKEIRYGLYRLHARSLGYKERTPLPACVTSFMTHYFPDPNNEYTGFKPKEEDI